MQHLLYCHSLIFHMNDAELISQVLKGNMNAFEFLVNRYQKLVLHISGRMIQRQDDLEDVCQDVFIKIYRNLKNYRKESSLSTWIAKIAYNTSLDHLRKYRKANRSDFDDIAVFEKTAGFRHDQYEKDDLYRYIRKQIERLPVQYRTGRHCSTLRSFRTLRSVRLPECPMER